MALRAETTDDPEALLVLESDVLQDLPSFFRLDADGKLSYDETRVNVFSYDKRVKNAPLCRKTRTIEEFRIVKERLLTLPIYIRSVLLHESKFCCAETQKTAIFLIVNTAHLSIKTQLKDALDKAEEAYERGANFSVEFLFGKHMPAFDVNASLDAVIVTHNQDHLSFCVTNFRRRVHGCYEPVIGGGAGVLIVWIGIGIYRLYRHIASQDIIPTLTFTLTKGGSLLDSMSAGEETV